MDRFEGRKLRWGLLGAGKIVDRWMKGALQCGDMEVAAVASRTRQTAEKTAVKWNIPKVMTLDEMVNSPEIDVTYIPVPHPAHKELAIRALRNHKAVLVEKPAAVNCREFEEMCVCARENHTFLMEATWTRFFPAIGAMKKMIAEGAIGRPRVVQASFAYRADGDWGSRAFDPAQAGGGLLDVGVYTLHFADIIYDKPPVKIMGVAAMDTDERHMKVDEQAAYTALYDQGEMLMGSCAVRTNMPDTAYIYGETGYMEIPVFWKPDTILLYRDGEKKRFDYPVLQTREDIQDEGYQYEIRHVNECLRNGLTESPVMPFEKTERVLRQCDALRSQWGLVFPCEKG